MHHESCDALITIVTGVHACMYANSLNYTEETLILPKVNPLSLLWS